MASRDRATRLPAVRVPECLSGRLAAHGRAAARGGGAQFGPFRLLGEIARGGMGVVNDALHTGLNRRVALKLLASPLAASPHAVARMRREAELTARLNHPHIVPIHDAGMVDGVPFHAMERIDGGDRDDVAELRRRAADRLEIR